MNILIVGNVLKDVYLSLDSRTEPFETDKNNVKWLDFSFDTSEHHFFRRSGTFGGAAVSLEVLQKMGLAAGIIDSDFTFDDEGAKTSTPAGVYRYILTSDDSVSYLVPSELKRTNFVEPSVAPDYLYVDRSAFIDESSAKAIREYLDANMSTALILYLKDLKNPHLNSLIPNANLIFTEQPEAPELADVNLDKIVHISAKALNCKNITEPISVERIDKMTHLSAYSIAAATVLGGFILGKTVEISLKMARINVENSTLDSVLSLEELEGISVASSDNLELIAASLVYPGKGILAADESGGSIHKKFEALGIADTAKNRHIYRNIFLTTPNIEKYLSGVILFDETARDNMDDRQPVIDFLIAHRIIPGIKVDQGLEKFAEDVEGVDPEETYTKGLDDLPARLREYYEMGLRFAKWRAAFELRFDEDGKIKTPTPVAITENCRILAEYAATSQSAGLVPIVEPELVYDGDYSITKCAEVTGKILDALFRELRNFGVKLNACILKCNMVLAGKQYKEQSSPAEVGRATAEVLKRHVPSELAGIVFLSGGQAPEQATANLAEIEKNGPFPWGVTFSFARALQDSALYAWAGDSEKVEEARKAFSRQLKTTAKVLG